MISQKPPCVFVHIPKTGGQSIELVFLGLHGLTWNTRAPLLLRPNDDPALGPPVLAHLTAEDYTRLGHVSADDWERWFTFAFVRNPYDRLLSEYRYSHRERPAREWPSFRSWVLEHFPKPGWSDPYNHVRPQVDYIYSTDGVQLVDFVGRFERISQDWPVICDRLGIEVPLPHRNRTRTLPGVFPTLRRFLWSSIGWDAYDADTREFVRKYYANDFEAFDYDVH